MVGTHWLWVTAYCSISASACSGSNFDMITSVPPVACTMPPKRNGAAW